MDQMLDRVAGLDVHKKTVTVCVRDCRLQRPATPVLQALGDPGREAPPDGRPRDARRVPGRSRRAGGQRHQSSAPAHADTRRSSSAWLQAHTQSDFGTVGATKHGHRERPPGEPGVLRAPREFAAGLLHFLPVLWSTSAMPPQGP